MPTETFGYTGDVQTWDASTAGLSDFTVQGPGGGGSADGNVTASSGGWVSGDYDASAVSGTFDIYVGGGGGGVGGFDPGPGGWGYVNGGDGADGCGGGGGLSAVIDNNGLLQLKAGGGTGAEWFDNTPGEGADWQSGQATGDPVGGDPGTAWVNTDVSNETINAGGGMSGGIDGSDGTDGEIVIDYNQYTGVTLSSDVTATSSLTGVSDVIGYISGSASSNSSLEGEMTLIYSLKASLSGTPDLSGNTIITLIDFIGSASASGNITSALIAGSDFQHETSLVAIHGHEDDLSALHEHQDNITAVALSEEELQAILQNEDELRGRIFDE